MEKRHGITPIKLLQGLTSVYLYLMFSVFILYCGTGGYQEIQTAKWNLFLLLCGGYLAVLLVLRLELILIGEDSLTAALSSLRRTSWVQRLVLAYMGLTWLSALTSSYFPETLVGVSRNEGALTISIYCLCFWAVSAYGTISRRLLYALGGVLVGFCLLCLVQLSGANPFALYPEGLSYQDAYISYSGAYLGTIGNVDLVAALLCLLLPCLLVAALRLTGKLRCLLLLPVALGGAVIAQMDVMAGIVGLGLGCVISLPMVLPLSGKTKKRLYLGIFAAGITALIVLWAIDLPMELLHEIHELLHGNLDDSFGSSRIYIWKNVLALIPQHWLLGAGPDTMLYSGIASFTRYDSTLGMTIVSQIDVAHNECLNILYHQGIFALAAYLAALGLLLRRIWQQAKRNPFVAILGSGLVCYFIQAMFSFSICIVAPLFWIVLGLLERLTKEDSPQARPLAENHKNHRRKRDAEKTA